MAVLGSSELKVILFIFDRTWGWSKDFERIPLSHFTDGVKGFTKGTGLSERSVVRALAWLEENEVIEVEREDGRSNKYAIRWDWKPKPEEEKTMLRKPKKPKELPQGGLRKPKTSAKMADHSCQNDGADLCQNGHRKSMKVKSKKNKSMKVVDESFDSPQSALEYVEQKDKERAKKRAKKARSAFARVADIEDVWTRACHEHFKGMRVLPWGQKERGQISTLRKKWISAGGTPETFIEFLEWVIDWWPDLMRGKFRWMRGNQPSVPSLGFLVVHKEEFLDAFGNGRPYRLPQKDPAPPAKKAAKKNPVQRVSQLDPVAVAKQVAERNAKWQRLNEIKKQAKTQVAKDGPNKLAWFERMKNMKWDDDK